MAKLISCNPRVLEDIVLAHGGADRNKLNGLPLIIPIHVAARLTELDPRLVHHGGYFPKSNSRRFLKIAAKHFPLVEPSREDLERDDII